MDFLNISFPRCWVYLLTGVVLVQLYQIMILKQPKVPAFNSVYDYIYQENPAPKDGESDLNYPSLVREHESPLPRLNYTALFEDMMREGFLSREGTRDFGIHPQEICRFRSSVYELAGKAEPLIEKEPLEPWITWKENVKNIKYISSMVNIRFKNRYIYVDVGAGNYNSSIGSWFTRDYPKQDKPFDIYAIEKDCRFYEDYKLEESVTLLPYAAWVTNQSFLVEAHEPSSSSSYSSCKFDGGHEMIQGFDFAMWLKNEMVQNDYVVVKMDVGGDEFQLIPRLIDTGAICLIDELLLDCHYNEWSQAGVRNTRFQNTFDQCLLLFRYLREIGVLAHQWRS